MPAGSSWGGDGTYEFWLNEKNDWIWPPLHQAADRMEERVARSELVSELKKTPVTVVARVLRQMMRELLLAQSSDWPFILRTGTSPEYARKRLENHLARFWALDAMLDGAIDAEALGALEAVDWIFPDCDPLLYRDRP